MLTKAELSRLRSLRDKRNREKLGLFIVEGEKVISELIAANFAFSEIYATSEWKGGKTHIVTNDEMARASHFPTPSCVLAVGLISRPSLVPEELNRGLTLALDGVQDPGNVGTLLRIADWFAFDRVVLSSDSADLFNQKVINASMGSFARMRIYTADLAMALMEVTAPILGCDLTGKDVHSLPPLENAIIVIGSEGQGLSSEVSDLVSNYITIPRLGSAESLNASIAAAIVCDNLRRRQQKSVIRNSEG